MDNDLSHLDACEIVLRTARRPMTTRELYHAIIDQSLCQITGSTPWKTLNARLSAEILGRGENSTFLRVDHGRFSLREWPNQVEHKAVRRKINPIEEDIAVLEKSKFLKHIRHLNSNPLLPVDYCKLISESTEMRRKEAELTEEFVQIIPLFFVHNGSQYLTHKRTKRLPEKRLSSSRTINFGGHLQLTDYPTLFSDDAGLVDLAIQRELREELSFTPDVKKVRFLGGIYDETTMLGRQHIGIVFSVIVPPDVTAQTNEPGYLTALEFKTTAEIEESRSEYDSWSLMVFDAHAR